MGRWLTDLDDVMRRTGYPVVEVEGWQNRSRGGAGGAKTNGFESGRPTHVMIHHTASGPNSDGWPDVNYCTFNDDDAPLCNLYLARDGTIYVCAAAATNCNGSGQDPCGVCPDDSMNSHALAIEAGNNGVGETWPEAQQDSYVKLCAELCAAYSIGNDQIHSHFEWTSAKTDPAGQSRYAPGKAMWDMDLFRGDVAAGGGGGPAPEPTPEPEEDDMGWIGPYLIQATGKDGTRSGAVYATDGRMMLLRYLGPAEEELKGYRWTMRTYGVSAPELEDGAPIPAIDTIDAYGVVLNPEEVSKR